MSAVQRLEATISGVVQGVGFRWFIKRHADRLGLGGWVANQPDGSVGVVAEGEPAALVELVALLREGPPGARVTAVETELGVPAGTFDGFGIRARAHAGD